MNVAAKIDSLLTAMVNCHKSNNVEWADKHEGTLRELESTHLPSGSGIDSGIEVYKGHGQVPGASFELKVPYHHMNEDGMYTHWHNYQLAVHASFDGVDVRVAAYSEKGDEDTQEYLCEMLIEALEKPFS
jgi:hypothetical protein